MFDYSRYIDTAGMKNSMTTEQKAADIQAIDEVLGRYGVSFIGGIESYTTVQYRYKLTANSNIARIMKLRTNLCIALDDDTVRMYREKSELVIEKKACDNTIRMGNLYGDYFINHKGLPLMLGVDTGGKKVVTDLRKAPHILIAGTTGSGKSVLENAMICSLLMKNPELEIYGIDTKRVEFQPFAVAPNFHLITNAAEATTKLAHLCAEMERRYTLLVKAKANDITEYNEKGGNMNPIVVVIDEFADLMLLSGKSVEEYVVRLAQKARACGIHLIIATQRPTRDVVTGLIKANIPTKICLHVTSALDSRVVMDRNGGEQLAGKGDMLYLGNGSFEPIRIQGVFVDNGEKSNIAAIARSLANQKAEQNAPKKPSRTTMSYFNKLFSTT